MNKNIQLSDHFSLVEATMSQTAARKFITNFPLQPVVETMSKAAVRMEKIRALLGEPIVISSWFRSPELNVAVGGSPKSQHCNGEAVDFISPRFGDPLDICKVIIANADLIRFDQLILEHSWVHISFAITTGKPRNQVLSLVNGSKYAQGLTDNNGVPYE